MLISNEAEAVSGDGFEFEQRFDRKASKELQQLVIVASHDMRGRWLVEDFFAILPGTIVSGLEEQSVKFYLAGYPQFSYNPNKFI